MKPADSTFRKLLPAAILAFLLPAATSAATSYGYVSALEGSAEAVSAGDGQAQGLELNQPLLTGQRISVAPGSRAEMVLADNTILRLNAGADLELAALYGSADVEAPATTLRLSNGSLQLVLDDVGGGRRAPRVDTANATVYFLAAGEYLVESDSSGWTRVVVRAGRCEVRTGSGSRRLEAGDEGTIDAVEGAGIEIADAGPLSTIERWGESQQEAARESDAGYVDSSLRYSARSLQDSGTWVAVDGTNAWRPRVDTSWRPYWQGRWTYTPSGLTWVAGEPWGWVTHHYGNWDFRPGFGWLWFPGSSYSPAWVYWYWGPEHVGWCPTGYYTHYYGSGLRLGAYGWAGGWNGFRDWSFVPTRYFGSADQARHSRRGFDLQRELGDRALPRGFITTDTRGFTRDRWQRPEELLRRYRSGAGGRRPGEDLPDVSGFVARQRDLLPDVRRRVGSGSESAPQQWQDRGQYPGQSGGQRERQQRPPAPSQQPARDWRGEWRQGPVQGGDAPRYGARPSQDWRSSAPRTPVSSSPGWRDGGSSSQGSAREATPIRRIVDGVRHAPVDSRSGAGGTAPSSPRYGSPAPHGEGSQGRPAQSSRPPRAESSSREAAPPPFGGR